MVGGARAVARCDALGQAPYSDMAGGLYRGYLTPAYAAAQDALAGWMADAGMTVRRDPAANLIGRYDGADAQAPALLIGSHLDSVRDGGRYDGPLGILLGIEVVAALHAAGRRMRFPIEVIAFGDEEGSRFPAAMLTSRAVAGTLDMAALEVADADGVTLADALAALPPFVLSEVEAQIPGAALAARASTSLSTNGEGQDRHPSASWGLSGAGAPEPRETPASAGVTEYEESRFPPRANAPAALGTSGGEDGPAANRHPSASWGLPGAGALEPQETPASAGVTSFGEARIRPRANASAALGTSGAEDALATNRHPSASWGLPRAGAPEPQETPASAGVTSFGEARIPPRANASATLGTNGEEDAPAANRHPSASWGLPGAGAPEPQETPASAGVTSFGEARIPEALAYLEAHIEQGPVLEAEGLAVGTVTGIAAQLRFQATVIGVAGHAGTASMPLRRDALAGAAEMLLAIERIARADASDLVATVGRLDALPGAANVIPGTVRFTIDIRSGDPARRDRAAESILDAIAAIADARGLDFDVDHIHDLPASPCDPALMDLLDAATAAAGQPIRRLVSGAGHDAMVMAALCPTAMLFVRCKGGISHNPAEHVDPADAETALQVMLGFIERLGDAA